MWRDRENTGRIVEFDDGRLARTGHYGENGNLREETRYDT